MKRLLAGMMAGLMLILPSCTIGAPISQTDEQRFERVLKDTENAVTIGAILLKRDMKPDARAALLAVTAQAKEAVTGGQMSLPDSLDALVLQFGDQLAKAGMKEDDIALIRATVRLADSALGGVQLGVNGVGDKRSQDVTLAVLRGIETGLK